MKNSMFTLLLVWFMAGAQAQSTIPDYLRSVEKNNKSIVANNRYWDAKSAEYKTGLTLYDPQIEYDFLWGFPSSSGNQQDFTLSQRLDFPSVYGKRKQLSRQQVVQGGFERSVFRQDLLLKAKLLCVELVMHHKKQRYITNRLQALASLATSLESKLDKGDATILDLNKIRLEVLELKHAESANRTEIENLKTRMQDLNGSQPFAFADTGYPESAPIPDFETLDSTIEANDPIIRVYEQEKKIAESNMMVQKALQLPGFEFGYHSQTILGQSYRGAHAGIVLPLWEKRNKVKATRLALEFTQANTERHREEHRSENKELYTTLISSKALITEYETIFSGMRNEALLEKSLRLGQITIVNYLEQQRYYYESYNRFLETEFEYQKAAAMLFKFTL